MCPFGKSGGHFQVSVGQQFPNSWVVFNQDTNAQNVRPPVINSSTIYSYIPHKTQLTKLCASTCYHLGASPILGHYIHKPTHGKSHIYRWIFHDFTYFSVSTSIFDGDFPEISHKYPIKPPFLLVLSPFSYGFFSGHGGPHHSSIQSGQEQAEMHMAPSAPSEEREMRSEILAQMGVKSFKRSLDM